jgi:hypothetical protein
MLRRNESENDIKNRVQDDDFENNTKRHFIFIRFVCAVNDQNFSIQKHHSLTNKFCKKKYLQ